MSPPKSKKKGPVNLLRGARVYLSGPMDFVASRASEKRHGWRNRVGQFLRAHGATVFDPWFKPLVKGQELYGYEDEKSTEVRDTWTFAPGQKGAAARARCAKDFWETLHIDLRMVDLSDFVIAYCPTNLYSVGTPHEIVMARLEHKPVLFVSPSVEFDALDDLKQEVRDNNHPQLERLVQRLETDVPIKANPEGLPSLWYMALVGTENFFDGFGFDGYRDRFRWKPNPADERERRRKLRRPLLPFLEKLATGHHPKRWNADLRRFERDDDWLVLELKASESTGR